jgi:hypothetical protein
MVTKRAQPKGGSRKGKPNKIAADVKGMILTALSDVGGPEYLARQDEQNPPAFMALVGKVLPLQVTGEGGGALVIRWEQPSGDSHDPL